MKRGWSLRKSPVKERNLEMIGQEMVTQEERVGIKNGNNF